MTDNSLTPYNFPDTEYNWSIIFHSKIHEELMGEDNEVVTFLWESLCDPKVLDQLDSDLSCAINRLKEERSDAIEGFKRFRRKIDHAYISFQFLTEGDIDFKTQSAKRKRFEMDLSLLRKYAAQER